MISQTIMHETIVSTNVKIQFIFHRLLILANDDGDSKRAVWQIRKKEIARQNLDIELPEFDPYFEDEVFAELGWSLEDKV